MRLILVLLFTAVTGCYAQNASQGNPVAAPITVLQNLPQLEIGNNDLLDVTVYDSPELSGTLRVGPDGTIALPMLQDAKPIKAAGLLPGQLAEQITKQLQDSQLVVHARVTVKVAEYQSRTVTVVGAVRHPISFQAYGRITLLEAIGRADGLSDAAGNEIIVSSGRDGGLSKLDGRINVTTLMSGKNPGDNMLLHGGEEVRVPEQGRISVLGDVKHPGVFPVKSPEESSVLILLARSEGVESNASATAYVYRQDKPGEPRHEVAVNLRGILDRKAPDMHLEPGDILYVPDNHGRRVTLSVLEHLSTLGGAVAGAVVYAGVR